MIGALVGAWDGTGVAAAVGWWRQFPIRNNHRWKKPHRNGQKIPQPNIPKEGTATAYYKYGTMKRKRTTTTGMVIYFATYIIYRYRLLIAERRFVIRPVKGATLSIVFVYPWGIGMSRSVF
jgi:hypothetical protein